MKLLSGLVILIALVTAVFTVSVLSKEQYEGNVFLDKYNENNIKLDYEKTILKKIIDKQEKKGIEISDELKENAYKGIKEKLQEQERVDIIVWVKEGYSPQDIISNLEEFDVKYVYNSLNGFAGTANEKEINLLKEDSKINYIALDEEVVAQLLQSRVLIRANLVNNNLGLTGDGIGVCHLDTGVNYNHPNLAHAYAGGYDFVNNDPDPMDDHGHGTSTAGVIVSNHTFFKGIATGADLVAVKVLNASGIGTISDVTAGINWCVANKNTFNIEVISMSLGTLQTYTPATNPAFYDQALQTASNNNIASVAGAGNNGVTNGLIYPAISPYVTSTGASYDNNLGGQTWTFGSFTCTDTITYADKVTCFSNRASFLDLMAPGAIIGTTSLSALGLSSFGGTSFAAPHVSGTIALMAQRNKNLLPSQTENILKSTGVQIYDNATGLSFPRVDALNSVSGMPYLSKNGSLAPNSIISLNVNAPGENGNTYFVALALTTSPGIPLPDGREIPLTIDPLLLLSIQNPNSVFLSYSVGIINNNIGQATMTIPNIPGIQNVEAYAAFITINQAGQIVSVSNSVRL